MELEEVELGSIYEAGRGTARKGIWIWEGYN